VTTETRQQRRYPWIAALLSLITPGLGHIYCGELAKGLLLAFLYAVLLPLCASVGAWISLPSACGIPCSMEYGVLVALAAVFVLWIAAVVSSFRSALRTRYDYKRKEYNKWGVYLLLFLTFSGSSIAAAFSIRAGLVVPFRIPTASNYPTLVKGDQFFANKIVYWRQEPRRGDLVVFDSGQYRNGRRDLYIKRIVAIGGDTVEIRNNSLFINGTQLYRDEILERTEEAQKREYPGRVYMEENDGASYMICLLDKPSSYKYTTNFPHMVVPQGHCFLLGDNRNLSKDSRYAGTSPLSSIVGRADFRYYPAQSWRRFGRIQ